jgi:acetyl-CoA C-acetyltransferase
MGRRVAIVNVAQTKYGVRSDVHIPELAFEPVEEILNKTGLKFTEDGTGIDATVTCCDDYWDGRTISGVYGTDVAGGNLRHEERLEADGTLGVYYGVLEILAGHADIVLAISYCKESHTEPRLIENMSVEPIFLRPLGIDFLSAAALQANRYMKKYGVAAEQCAKVVVKNRRNAKLNPFAQLTAELTVEEIMGSEMLAYPIRALDSKPVSDGASAVILAAEDKARKLTDKPVWIAGIADCYDLHYPGDRELGECPSLVKATQKAYGIAGITKPVEQIDIVELCEAFSYQELLWSEGLGLCDPGEGGRLIDSGMTEIGEKIPINPSGGMLSGNPVIVGGMTRIVEAVLQLRGEAGSHQVDGAKRALIQGCQGICGQHQCVIILTSDVGGK